jgi:hypothetical protein
MADIRPISIEVFCEWKRILSLFSDSQPRVRCLHFLCFHFVARLRCNSFAITATAFALRPLGETSIRASEQGFQTQQHIDQVIPGAIMISMRKEFKSILASDLDFIFENARPDARLDVHAPPQHAALNALDLVPLDLLDFSEGPSDPDAESFGGLLETERQHILEDQLRRNLLDSIIAIAEGYLCDHGRSCSSDAGEISVASRLWR